MNLFAPAAVGANIQQVKRLPPRRLVIADADGCSLNKRRLFSVKYTLITIAWISQWALWVAFADNSGFRELVIGALVSAVTILAAMRFSRGANDHFKLCNKDLRQIVHIPAKLVSDTLLMFRVIGLRLRGKNVPSEVISVPYDIGDDSPATRGRRALAITFLTFAPNNLVFGFLPDQQVLFFHTVIPQPLPEFMFSLGASLEPNGPAS